LFIFVTHSKLSNLKWSSWHCHFNQVYLHHRV